MPQSPTETKLLPPLDPQEGWSEINAPELIKFEKPGESICGILAQIVMIKIEAQPKPIRQYTLTLGAKRFRFLETFDIRQKLGPEHRGCKVRIKYLGRDENIRGGPSNTPMKVFSIQIADAIPPGLDRSSPELTDEDIPF